MRRVLIAIGLAFVLTAKPVQAIDIRLSPQAEAAQAALAQAYASNDAESIAAGFGGDGRFLPDFQPAMKGADQIAAYWRAISARRRVLAMEFRAFSEVDLGDALMVLGVYDETRQRPGHDPETVSGKYVHVWRRDSEGELKLHAESRGYGFVWRDPAEDYVAASVSAAAVRTPAPASDPVGLDLDCINALIVKSVKSHDLSLRLPLFAEDFVFMPYGETPKRGRAQVVPFLTAYVRNGSGATYDSVDVHNDGYEVHGKYIIEYAKFRVDWHAGDANGRVSGGGIRLWERTASGPLSLKVEIATHDFRP